MNPEKSKVMKEMKLNQFSLEEEKSKEVTNFFACHSNTGYFML